MVPTGMTSHVHALDAREVFSNPLILGRSFLARQANGMTGDGAYRPARDLLMLTAPRIGGRPIKGPDEITLSAAVRIAPT